MSKRPGQGLAYLEHRMYTLRKQRKGRQERIGDS